MADNNAQKVRDIIEKELGVEREKLSDEASFIEDLGADSLDIVELVMEFEKEFNIDIPDEDAEKLRTVGDAIGYLNQKIGSGALPQSAITKAPAVLIKPSAPLGVLDGTALNNSFGLATMHHVEHSFYVESTTAGEELVCHRNRVRCENHVLERKQGVIGGRWLRIEDVDARAGDSA